MGTLLGRTIAKGIMTELEKKVVNDFIKNGRIKFCTGFVVDTLLLVKREYLEEMIEKFDSFDKNLKFILDYFDDAAPHFLDLEIHPVGITIFQKDTHTGKFTYMLIYTPRVFKLVWIRSLAKRGIKICSRNKFKADIAIIKRFAPWNFFRSKL